MADHSEGMGDLRGNKQLVLMEIRDRRFLPGFTIWLELNSPTTASSVRFYSGEQSRSREPYMVFAQDLTSEFALKQYGPNDYRSCVR